MPSRPASASSGTGGTLLRRPPSPPPALPPAAPWAYLENPSGVILARSAATLWWRLLPVEAREHSVDLALDLSLAAGLFSQAAFLDGGSHGSGSVRSVRSGSVRSVGSPARSVGSPARSVGSASLSPVGEGGSEPGLAHGGPTTRVIKYALPVFKPPDSDPMAEEYPTVESGLAAPKTQRQILPGQHAAMSVEIVCLGRVPQRALIYRLVTVRNLLIG